MIPIEWPSACELEALINYLLRSLIFYILFAYDNNYVIWERLTTVNTLKMELYHDNLC